jgi:hypothetical protein
VIEVDYWSSSSITHARACIGAGVRQSRRRASGQQLIADAGVISSIMPNIFELLDAYRERDPAANSRLEVLLLYPGVKAVTLHRIAHTLRQWGWPFVPRAISEIGRWLTGIEIHPGAVIG